MLQSNPAVLGEEFFLLRCADLATFIQAEFLSNLKVVSKICRTRCAAGNSGSRGKIWLGIPLQDFFQTKNLTQTPLHKRRGGPSEWHLKQCHEAKSRAGFTRQLPGSQQFVVRATTRTGRLLAPVTWSGCSGPKVNIQATVLYKDLIPSYT